MCVAEPAVPMSVVAGDSVRDEEEMLVAGQKPAVRPAATRLCQTQSRLPETTLCLRRHPQRQVS